MTMMSASYDSSAKDPEHSAAVFSCASGSLASTAQPPCSAIEVVGFTVATVTTAVEAAAVWAASATPKPPRSRSRLRAR